jgi:hypothetical protein
LKHPRHRRRHPATPAHPPPAESRLETTGNQAF